MINTYVEKPENNLNRSLLFHRYVCVTYLRSHGLLELELEIEPNTSQKLQKGPSIEYCLPCHHHLNK